MPFFSPTLLFLYFFPKHCLLYLHNSHLYFIQLV
nr:MAG TPA: hypothetical protein [Caudoviricetes sp.]